METKESVKESKTLKPKVATKLAEEEFGKFIEAMELDVDPDGMDDEDKASFVSAKRVILKCIESNHLVVNEDGEPVYTPRKGDKSPITFHEPTGASYMAMDQKKKNHDMTKLYSVLADMTEEPIQRFAKMKARDTKVCQAIIGLFLG